MSSQSIYIKTIDSVRNTLEKDMLKQAKNFLLKERFMLGNGTDRKQRNHALMTLSYICTENCELIDSINAQLNGCDGAAYVPEEKSELEKIVSRENTYHNYSQATTVSNSECADCVNWENKSW
jgi:hypothetical protein